MSRRRSSSSLLSCLLLIGATVGCRQRSFTPVSDAATDGSSSDGPAPLTLQIAVTGCATYEPATTRCSGPAPLTLSFSPVGSPEFTRFTWSFGDGSLQVSDRAPMHVFVLPGSYQVSLVGAFGAANFVQTTAVVSVEPRPAGAPCDIDAQCNTGLRCACAPGSGCAPAFVRGLCSAPCDAQPCGPDAVCAALPLTLAAPVDGGSPSRHPWCVADCQTSACATPGFACEALAAAGTGSAGAWTQGCLPIGALADFGAPCRDANGVLDDASCATGSCADLGALGICSLACGPAGPCPPGTACAALADGRQLCLIDCDLPAASCASDPLLTCAAPTPADAGPGGFRADAAPGTTYCAPKPCASDADCAPAGHCGPGATCVRS